MARLSKAPKTPQGQIIADEEVEDEVNAGATELDWELDVNPANNGQVLHLGSDLPDLPADAWESQSSPVARQFGAPVADMGANNSREEVNAALRATSDELLKRDEAARKSTGKLKRPSNRKSNPPYQNPVREALGQRKLAPTNNIRKSTYELGDSPVKLSPAKARIRAQQPEFSPRRSERRKAAPTDEQHELRVTVQTPEIESSPRRSKRQQDLQATVEDAQNDEGTIDASNEALYRDYLRHDVVRNAQVQAAEAGAEENDEGNIQVAEVEDAPASSKKQAVNRQQEAAEATAAKPKGKPGRPPKKSRRQSSGAGRPRKDTNEQTTSAPEPQATRKSPRKATTLPPQKKKAGRPSAAQNLRNRRDGVNGEEGQDDDGEDQNKEPDEGVARQPVAANSVQIERVRAGELFAGQTSDLTMDDQDAPEEEAPEPIATSKRKRVAKKSSQANTSRKRQRVSEGDEAEDAEQGEVNPQQRLWKQWLPLQKIFASMQHVGCNIVDGERQQQNDIELNDPDVKAVMKLCKEVTKRFTKLKDHSVTIQEDEEPAPVLCEIAERLEGLQGTNDDFPTDFEDKWKSTNIYLPLIPRLVKLVRHAIMCYVSMDKDEALVGQIKIRHLRIVQNLITMILNLEVAAKIQYVRPDSDLRIVLPVHNDIAVPLRDVRRAFGLAIQKHEDGVRETKRKEEEATQRALRLEQEERQSRQQTRIQRLQDKWNRLHDERMWAEGGFMKPRKREHLQMPSDSHIELDQNGLPFSRQEVFMPRVGPPPGLVDEAAALEWTPDELIALADGLRVYTGPNVFERVFRKYCPAGKELNRFNVTEIVTTAAILRERLVEHQSQDEEQEGEVEKWVLDIPIWTKGQPALGKENEDSLVDVTAEAEVIIT